MKSELDIIENVQELNELISILHNKKVILYGASSYGSRMLSYCKKLDIDVIGFCDSNSEKKGTFIDNKQIYSLDEIINMYKKNKNNYFILIASSYVKDIRKTLLENEIEDEDICSAIALELGIHINIKTVNLTDTYKKEYYKEYAQWLLVNAGKYERSNTRNEKVSNFCNEKTIKIYTAGKVGTHSLVKSINQRGIYAQHIHSLDVFGDINSDIRKKAKSEFKTQLHNTKKLKIITVVREPINRNLSSFMHELQEPYHYQIRHINGNFIFNIQKNIERYYMSVLEQLSTKYLEKDHCWLDEFEWFQQEVKDFLDIDVYQYPFDKQKGYTKIIKDNIELLVLQLEKIDSLQDLIGDFIGISDFKILKENDSQNKPYYWIYQELKEKIVWSKEYIDFYYKDNLYMNHFYSQEDQERFKNKWIKD